MSWNFKGLSVADISDCGINLMYLPFDAETEQPKFKECARHPKVDEEGFVLYYIIQINVLLLIIGCRVWWKWQKNKRIKIQNRC